MLLRCGPAFPSPNLPRRGGILRVQLIYISYFLPNFGGRPGWIQLLSIILLNHQNNKASIEDEIRNLEIVKNTNGELTSIKVVFGPHYFLEVIEVDGRQKFLPGVTHHDFEADASEVGKGLEEIIWHIKEKFPETSFD